MSDDVTYTAGEQARRVALGVRGALRAHKGRSTDRIDDRLDRIAEQARLRAEAEQTAREAADAKRRAEKAAKKHR